MKSALESKLTALRIIHFAIFSGTIAITGILLFISRLEISFPQPLNFLFPGIGFMAIVFSFFLIGILIKPNGTQDNLQKKLSNFTSFKMIQFSILEGATILNCIGYGNGQNPYSLYTVFILLVFLMLSAPKVSEFKERYAIPPQEQI